ncbi:MAG: histidinol dehydrogenase [Bryobacterales bacterium]|nr:histidinol dehydrogenase [Bryobacterales bacterium]
MLRILSSRDREAVGQLLRRRADRLDEAQRVVEPIIQAIRERGDDALCHYARRLDGLSCQPVRVPLGRIAEAQAGLAPDFADAVALASGRIRAYAERQMPAEWMEASGPGIELGQLVRPLAAVGAYIPGGRYPLPSTLMMTAVPAMVAGVERIAIASPRPADATLGTAGLLGLDEVYAIGGAQAIAAFAFGTQSIPKVDRVVGPGNSYVAAAKKLLAGETGIDFVAGPTEIVLIFDEGDPQSLAADMLAQAEHDVDAAAILLTPSRSLAEAVVGQVAAQVETLPTREVAAKAIRDNSAAVVTDSLAEACDLSNRIAPEHLAVSESVPLQQVRHAGSLFVGRWSPEAAGDYAAGPNHVLPTGGSARLRGGLSVLDYVKIVSVQKLTEAGLASLAPVATTLARAEGLEAHARSIESRMDARDGLPRA